MKHFEKSVRAKLYNISKCENINFQHLIIRFLHERLLYRISVSEYCSNFCLKGGTLLYTMKNKGVQRYTLDIDFSLRNLPYNADHIAMVIQNICEIVDNDGVTFDPQSIGVEEIKENDPYGGLRIFVDAGLDTIQQRLQIDIGHGEKIYPEPVRINFPVLIDQIAIPIVYAYSPETVIAEKFQAMIELADLNSRMKDFYDVYNLIRDEPIDREILQEAIYTTFTRRQTLYKDNHPLFNPSFYQDNRRQSMWKGFLRKTDQNQKTGFEEVVATITRELKPLWENLKLGLTP